MTRYSWRRDEDHVEHFDSKAEMDAAKDKDTEEAFGCLFAFVGLIVGGAASFALLKHFDLMDWPKWARFACVAAGAGVTAFVVRRLTGVILLLLGLAIAGTVLTLIGRAIWRVV